MEQGSGLNILDICVKLYWTLLIISMFKKECHPLVNIHYELLSLQCKSCIFNKYMMGGLDMSKEKLFEC